MITPSTSPAESGEPPLRALRDSFLAAQLRGDRREAVRLLGSLFDPTFAAAFLRGVLFPETLPP